MAVLVPNVNGHIQNQLTRSLERILEEASQSGELKLSNRKLKEFPKAGSEKYNLSDTVIADQQLADVFTKPLPAVQFKNICKRIGLEDQNEA